MWVWVSILSTLSALFLSGCSNETSDASDDGVVKDTVTNAEYETDSFSASDNHHMPEGDSETVRDSEAPADSDTGESAYPIDDSPVTQGGSITFTNIGSSGWWPRRLDKPNGDPACDYKDGDDTWGGVCCMTEHHTDSIDLAPFNEEMILILKALKVKQLAVYQPSDGESSWTRKSFFDARDGGSENFTFVKSGDDHAPFDGELTNDDCVWYVMQTPSVNCDTFDEYYCPDDSGITHLGWSGSKLIAFLGNMDFEDTAVSSCNGEGAGHPGPWVAFVAAELVRDGARKWNGLCNCYSKTDSVGDGCGEINVFEVVMDNNEYSNREFISTGIRSYQNGHVGGSVCGSGCDRDHFGDDVDVVDACGQNAYGVGPVVESGGNSDGCPVFRRPKGDRFFMILLDEVTRTIQVAMVHPQNVPGVLTPLFPGFPNDIPRTTIDGLSELRLP